MDAIKKLNVLTITKSPKNGRFYATVGVEQAGVGGFAGADKRFNVGIDTDDDGNAVFTEGQQIDVSAFKVNVIPPATPTRVENNEVKINLAWLEITA